MQNLALISLFSPFVAFLFASFFSLGQKRIILGYICSLLISFSAISSLILLFYNQSFNIILFEWISIIGLSFGFSIDSISLVMMSVVGIVASLVHFYSIFI